MRNNAKTKIAILLVISMLLSGCTGGETEQEPEEIPGCMDEAAENYNPDATVSDRSCIYPEPEPEPEPEPDVRLASQSEFCDDVNPHHCMLPFPAPAFLVDDGTTATGYRLHIPGEAIPDSGSGTSDEFHMINRVDGYSPSTQIFTTFESTPDVSGMADQYSIGDSLDSGHSTLLINLDTGELLPHWVEVDMRSQDDEATFVYIRTIRGLDHDASYGVGYRNLVDSGGNSIDGSDAFVALRDGLTTDSPQIESQRAQYEGLFEALGGAGVERASLQAAWFFHTASTASILQDIVHMRDDASQRLGDDGIGCNVTEVVDGYGDDNATFRLIRGTFSTPQYMESDYPPAEMRRDSSGTPEFIEFREVVFTILIPQILADEGRSGLMTVLGHGFMGDGDGMATGSREFANLTGRVMIATDWKGWSADGDFDALTYSLINVEYFQHQHERHMQSIVNNLAMIRTFTGVCADLQEFVYEGNNLVDGSNVDYWGISFGGLRGPALMSMVPEVDRGVLWVGGSSFTQQIERSTHYITFEMLFAESIAYPSRNDRGIMIATMQSIWDSLDAETFLPYHENGIEGLIQPFQMLYITSMNDFQVSTLSCDRAVRTAGIQNLESSPWHPWGVDLTSGPIEGSGVVYFDGDFPEVPVGNLAGSLDYHSHAHGQIRGVPEAYNMGFEYLDSGIIIDTCNDSCTFEGVWD